jgi:hypothetical protein
MGWVVRLSFVNSEIFFLFTDPTVAFSILNGDGINARDSIPGIYPVSWRKRTPAGRQPAIYPPLPPGNLNDVHVKSMY